MPLCFIAFREDSWFVPATEYQMYNNLANAYNGTSQMIRDWSEASVPAGYTVVVCAESGTIESKDYTHPANACYVFGRTGMADSDLISYAQPTDVIKLTTPQPVALWGVQTAAMIARDRERQGV